MRSTKLFPCPALLFVANFIDPRASDCENEAARVRAPRAAGSLFAPSFDRDIARFDANATSWIGIKKSYQYPQWAISPFTRWKRFCGFSVFAHEPRWTFNVCVAQ